MKTEMILAMCLKVCNVRLFPIGMRLTRGTCVAMAALVSLLMTGALQADTHYVNAARPDDSGDGLSWATAEKTIQAAIAASTASDTIVVTNGVYASITTTNNSITIQSVNGAAVTIIDGGRTARCATLGSSPSHTNTVLVGLTLRNGYAFPYGGGSYCGTLNNCMLTGNSAFRGGGASAGTLSNCTLTGNRSTLEGGGAYGSMLNNCTLSENSASNGGGSYGGTLNNCTLTGNSSSSSGGGAYAGTLNNCIVWGNMLVSGGTNNYSGSIFRYSCTTPQPTGTGNLSDDPLFRLPAAGDYRLLPGSPCLDKGANSYAVGAVDGAGNPRIQNGTVDMGAYEGPWTLSTDAPHLARNVSAAGGVEGVTVSWDPPSVGGAILYRVFRIDLVTGRWNPVSGWISELSFLDTQVFGGVIYRYAIYSAFDARFDVISGLSASAEGQRTLIPQFYVDALSPDDTGDGRSWTTAKRTIQAAIAVATLYDTIVVTNGIYAPISTGNKVIAIRSVNGNAGTIIDGGGTNRCATMGSSSNDLNTILVGFTLRNGYASVGGGSCYGTLNNCVLEWNRASSSGGGSHYGTLNNCILSGNSAANGGGSYDGTLNNCTLTGNSASSSGGGSRLGTLNNCISWGNTLASGVMNNYDGGRFSYSCAESLPSGAGNLSANPVFRLPVAGDYRLSPGSPCLNAGTNGYVVGSIDWIGNPRIQDGTVDMGSCEGAGTLATDVLHLAQDISAVGGADGITVSWHPPSTGGAILYRVCRMDMAMGQWLPVSGWVTEINYLDMRVFGGVIYRYAIVTAFDPRLDVISGLSASAEGQRILMPQLYVDASRPDDAGDGRGWTTAKKTIQAAIGASTLYDTILVTNGVYAPISTGNKAIMIRSVNGADVTIIDGGGTNRCATLGYTTFDVNTVLNGFTLRNGFASTGGGSCHGTVNSCKLFGNCASSGGGSYDGRLNYCILSENSASDGGGAYDGRLNNCALMGNSASSAGGGSRFGTLNNCTLTGNCAPSGGGSHDSTLNNCTLTGNIASSSGGGSRFGMLNNCIDWGNTLDSGVTNNYDGGTFSYSCTTPLPSGTGNISTNPLFRLSIGGDLRLSPGSACLNAGTNGYAVGVVDGFGNPRIQDDTVDMGAYEGIGTLTTDASCLARNVIAVGGTEGIAVSWNPPTAGGAVLYRVCRLNTATGQWVPVSCWITELSYQDNRVFCDTIYRYAIISSFDTRLDFISGLSAPAEGQSVQIPQLFVDVSRPNDTGDGRSWLTAKRSIQAAIDVSLTYDTILVTNGVYAPFSTTNKRVAIRSVNGADVTVIDGGGTNRCATLGISSVDVNTVLAGFTLRNGYASSGGGSCYGTVNNCKLTGNTASAFGGGSSFGMLNNCMLSGNSAHYGGGSYYGTLNNCTLEGNRAPVYNTSTSVGSNGGGAYYGTLNNCTLEGNSAIIYGGGAIYVTLNNCTLKRNTALCGGGAHNSVLNNCTLTGNSAASGGGAYYGTLNNCTLEGNIASDQGGGSYYSALNNCTLTGNRALYYGGGSYEGTLNNCIVWGNTLASRVTNNYSGGMFNYSCTTPLPSSGTGNISGDPLFRLPTAGDYRLSPGSPCLDKGGNGYVVGPMDGVGNPRIQNDTVDMGACEGAGTQVTDASYLALNIWITGGADGVNVAWDPPSEGGAVLYRVCRQDVETGQWTPVSDWISELNYHDTRVFSGMTYRYAIVSAFDTQLDVISGLSASADGQSTLTPQFYVNAARLDDAGDGRSWTTAKKTIQAAIGASAPYDTILVTNGVYASISTANKLIAIRSVNGAYVTIIDGGGTNRCATLGSSSLDMNTVLVGLTLRNGSASDGGGSCYGTLNNCTLTGNSSSSYGGGGSYYGTLNNCTLSRNRASYDGGGSYYGTLNNCTLTGNSAAYGGGSCNGTLNNCTLSGNSASQGGGSFDGTLNNCTLTGNNASSDGGGSYYGTLNNCIAWGNTLVSGVTNNYYHAGFSYSCTMPMPSGTGNISADPLLRMSVAGDFRLSPGSLCLNAGANGYAVGTVDVLGNPRIQNDTVDMGAYEGAGTLVTNASRLARSVLAAGMSDGVAVSWYPPSDGSAVLYRVCRMDLLTGQWMPVSGWLKESSFLDTQLRGGLTYRYAIVSVLDDRFDAISGLSAPAEGQRALPQLYVDALRPDDTGDGRSWATAKKTIQTAIGASIPYDTILVTNGVYAPVSSGNKEIAIRSVNGADVTIIDGGGVNRCATLGSSSSDSNTILEGFTLRNGSASNGGGSCYGTLNNCTLSANRASSSGGGSYNGTLNNCTLSENSASSFPYSGGGGSSYSALNNCTLSGNRASSDGGGSSFSTLNNCRLSGNSASHGGGSSYGTLNNCTLEGNSASEEGGGSRSDTLNNCTLTRNSASYGGGTYLATLNNCTLTGNIASIYGGGADRSTLNNCTLTGNSASSDSAGVDSSTLKNCIVWGNTLLSGVTNNYFFSEFDHSCTTPMPYGVGNIIVDPLFVDPANGDFHLKAGSPCIDTGNNASVVGTTDCAGNPRILDGRVDMGAYEMTLLAVTLDWRNGGDVTLTNVLYGQAYQVPPALFADATFLGWRTLPNGMGTCILPETVVSMTTNHTLYAHWDVNSVVGSTGLIWQTEGDSLWFVQTNVVTQGLSAMRSGVISDDQASWIGTTVTGPGQFSFWWRVSSEGGYDELVFAVDGVQNLVISGTKKGEWQVVEVAFTNAAAHEFRWTYSKDDSVSTGMDCGWLDRVAWIPAPPIIPGNPNVASNFLDNVTQAQVDALVAGLHMAHPDVTDVEIAKKFEDADLFGFTGVALVGVGSDALARLNPSITLSTLSVVEGDPRTLVVAVTIGNSIDPTAAEALARLGEAINSRMRGVFKNSLSAGASESLLTPMLSLDSPSGVVTATFTLENPSATSGFLRMSLRK